MRTLLFTLTAAGACALAAVGASKPLERLAASRPVTITVPAAPDSASSADNPFSQSSLMDAMQSVTPLQARQMMADYTTVHPDTAGKFSLTVPQSPHDATLQRFVTKIRPDAFFKGKVKISTQAIAKVLVDGKEVASKTSFDSIPSDAEGEFSLQPDQDAILEIRVLTNTSRSISAPTLKAVIESADADDDNTNISQSPDLPTLFNINTMAQGSRLASARISPDGAFLLLTYTYTANSVDTDYRYLVMETASRRIITQNLPAGCNWIAGADARLQMRRSNGDGTFDIETIDYPSQRHATIASRIPDIAKDYQLGPNGDYLIYHVKKDGATDDTGVMHRLLSPDDRQPGNRDRYYLSIIRFDEGVARPLTYSGTSTYLTAISPDGKKILYSSVRETPEQFPFYDVNLVQLDIKTLSTDTIPGIDSSFKDACYSSDGNKLFIMAGPNAFGGIGLNAGEFSWGNDFDVQGYLYSFAGNDIRPLTRDFNPSLGDAIWNDADGLLYVMAEEGFDSNLYTINPESGKITRLDTEVDYTRNYSVATRKANYLAYTGMSYTYMGRGYLLNLRNGKSSLIDDPMAPTLAGMEFGEWKPWSFTAADGTVIDGTMTLPPAFDPDKKYPLIVYYYGGTSPSSRVNHHPYTPQLLASRGYVVYVLNPSGTTGYGQEFSARHVNAWGDRTADEIIYGVKQFCKEHPFVDDKKIGCMGASYGGFMTQLLQTKTDIFAAAVSHAGISDITSYWGEGYWGYTYNAVAAARSYPWNNPKLFTEHSPLFNADKIHTPLLLLHGTADTNVPIGESIQLYNALRILNRPVEFITIEGSDHIVIDFEQRKQWHATIMAWFEKWLKGDSRWWDSIYKK